MLAQVTVALGPTTTFALYAIIAEVGHQKSLLTAQAFTSLSLILLLARPITELTQTVPSLAGSVGCLNRIQEFLSRASVSLDRAELTSCSIRSPSIHRKGSAVSQDHDARSSAISPAMLVGGLLPPQRPALEIREGAFGWKSDVSPILRDINITLKENSLTIITGPVGSGKSTLLKGLMGELRASNGRVTWTSTSLSYCDQIPWVMNGTVQHNIVGFSPFDQGWYDIVIHGCALDVDLDRMPARDHTPVGSRGIALSRGQKQRVVSLSI